MCRVGDNSYVVCPSGTSRLIDRGFAFCTAFYPHLNVAFVPHFMRGRTQMFPIEIISSRRMSQDRYTCEAVFSRAALHDMLKGILPYKNLRYVTDAAHCGHFSGQLMQPIMPPACWDEFIKEQPDDPKYPAPLDLRPIVITSRHSGESNTIVLGDHPESDVPTSSHEENSSLSDSSE